MRGQSVSRSLVNWNSAHDTLTFDICGMASNRAGRDKGGTGETVLRHADDMIDAVVHIHVLKGGRGRMPRQRSQFMSSRTSICTSARSSRIEMPLLKVLRQFETLYLRW